MRRTFKFLFPLSLVGSLVACDGGEGSPAAIQNRLTLESFGDCSSLEQYIEDEAVRDMKLQIDCYSQGKRIDSYQVGDVTLLISKRKKIQTTNDTVVLRAMERKLQRQARLGAL
jgi:hypothetical protein